MAYPISYYRGSKDNNFNIIRFMAASTVLLNHSFSVTGKSAIYDSFYKILDMSMGTIAVDIFFATSGFLVTASLLTRKNILSFIWARILRIYPALMVTVALCLVVGLLFTTLPFYLYLLSEKTYSFIFMNVTMIFGDSGRLPGVFENNFYKRSVNSSLWTLPWEIRMYAILALLGALAYAKKAINEKTLKYIVLLIAILSVTGWAVNYQSFMSKSIIRHGLHFLSLFFTGAALYVFKEHVDLSHRLALLISCLFLVSIGQKCFLVSYTLFISYIAVYLAYVPADCIRSFNKIGDYSYGIYIYAFPIQQSLVTLLPGISFFKYVYAFFPYNISSRNNIMAYA